MCVFTLFAMRADTFRMCAGEFYIHVDVCCIAFSDLMESKL